MENQKSVYTRLHLIRHGQTDWNKKNMIQGPLDNIPLNATGHQQAEATAQQLQRHYQVDVVFASEAARAQQTAGKICAAFGSELRISADLNEINFGAFSGSNINTLEVNYPSYFKAFDHFITTNRDVGTKRPHIPDGEMIGQIEERIVSFQSKILSEHRGKHIAAVTHASFMKCMIAYFSGSRLEDYLPYWIENASISVVDFFGSVPIIRRLNDTGHLENSRLDFFVPRII